MPHQRWIATFQFRDAFLPTPLHTPFKGSTDLELNVRANGILTGWLTGPTSLLRSRRPSTMSRLAHWKSSFLRTSRDYPKHRGAPGGIDYPRKDSCHADLARGPPPSKAVTHFRAARQAEKLSNIQDTGDVPPPEFKLSKMPRLRMDKVNRPSHVLSMLLLSEVGTRSYPLTSHHCREKVRMRIFEVRGSGFTQEFMSSACVRALVTMSRAQSLFDLDKQPATSDGNQLKFKSLALNSEVHPFAEPRIGILQSGQVSGS